MNDDKMTKEQYLRADGVVIKVMVLILLAMIISLSTICFTGKANLESIIIIVSDLVMLAGVLFFYFRFKGEKIGRIMITLLPALALTLLLTLGNIRYTYIYVYAFPMMITTIIYSNTKYIIWGSIILYSGNIIRTVREIMAGQLDGVAVILRWGVMMVAFIAMYYVVKLIKEFNNEKLEAIVAAAQKQESTNKNIIETTGEIAALFEKSNEVITSLKESITSNQFVVNNIADSTDSTAQAISHQVQMCNEIQASSEVAKEETNRVHEASSLAISNVEEGTKLVDELKVQAIVVENASKDTVEATQRLMTKVVSVKDIISDILNISSQTNLLALNASIEAARAGEAGKGFAVVAEEIRGLSEQTKEATNKIINIIEELNVEASHASESVDQSVQSIKKQNEMIETTKEKFDKINEEMNHLTVSVDKMKERMEEIISSTGVIVDNISQLSATSEEIAASSEDGNKNAQDSVERMEECSEVLDKIYQLSQKLSLN